MAPALAWLSALQGTTEKVCKVVEASSHPHAVPAPPAGAGSPPPSSAGAAPPAVPCASHAAQPRATYRLQDLEDVYGGIFGVIADGEDAASGCMRRNKARAGHNQPPGGPAWQRSSRQMQLAEAPPHGCTRRPLPAPAREAAAVAPAAEPAGGRGGRGPLGGGR